MTKIEEVKKANEMYKKALEEGMTAVKAQEHTQWSDRLVMDLGNVDDGDSVRVEFEYLMEMNNMRKAIRQVDGEKRQRTGNYHFADMAHDLTIPLKAKDRYSPVSSKRGSRNKSDVDNLRKVMTHTIK